MADAVLFGKEVKVEVPSTDRWYVPQGRSVRAFIKGPHRGVNEETGLCLLLHGQGGRQNDISWKMLRRSLAEKHNLLVVGVNYFGTALSEREMDFVNSQVADAYHYLRHNPQIQAGFERQELQRIAPEDFFYFENQRSAILASTPFPGEYWDWGVIQAIDAINALAWAANAAGLAPKRVSMVSRSAGCQVAFMALKLMPRLFASYLDLGGACYGNENREWMNRLLRDPFMHVAANDSGGLEFHNSELPFSFSLRKRWPLANLGRMPDLGPSIEDEVGIRDVGNQSHFVDDTSLSLLVAEQGRDDSYYSPAFKESIVNPFKERGVDASVRSIVESDCDGRLRDNTHHTFMKDYNALVLEDHEAIFQAERRGDASIGLFDEEERRFACESGDFVFTSGQVAQMRFEKRG